MDGLVEPIVVLRAVVAGGGSARGVEIEDERLAVVLGAREADGCDG